MTSPDPVPEPWDPNEPDRMTDEPDKDPATFVAYDTALTTAAWDLVHALDAGDPTALARYLPLIQVHAQRLGCYRLTEN
jgi:hypothetical protein